MRGTEAIPLRAHLRFLAKVSAAMDKILRGDQVRRYGTELNGRGRGTQETTVGKS